MPDPTLDPAAAPAGGFGSGSPDGLPVSPIVNPDGSPGATVDPAGTAVAGEDLAGMSDVKVTASVEVGRADLTIGQALNMTPGSIIELDRQSDQPLCLLLNGQVVAYGEVVVVDSNFGLRITEIAGQDEALKDAGQAGDLGERSDLV